MSEAKILGGVVTVEQSRKFAEYENRKVTYTFSIGEGDDAVKVATGAGDEALAHVVKLLNAKQYPDARNTGAAAVKVAEPVSENVAAAKAPAAPKVSHKKKDPTEIPETSKPAAEKLNISTGNERKDPAAVDDDDFLGANDAEAPVTDAQIQEACSKTKNRLTPNLGSDAGKAVKLIINKYVGGPPKGGADIPQELRAKFIAELAALTA